MKILMLIMTLVFLFPANAAEEKETITTQLQIIHNAKQEEEAVRNYFLSNNFPKVALYGEGVSHGKEKDYSLFLTVDVDIAASPTLTADIRNPEEMSVIPDGQLDCVWLRNIPSTVFSSNPKGTFGDIARVLKPGGELKFNDMWGGQYADDLKDKFLELNNHLQEKDVKTYNAIKIMEPKALASILREKRQLNPFDQYLTHEDFSKLGDKFTQTSLFFEDYKKQLVGFFDEIGFTNLTVDLAVDLEKEIIWIVYKK